MLKNKCQVATVQDQVGGFLSHIHSHDHHKSYWISLAGHDQKYWSKETFQGACELLKILLILYRLKILDLCYVLTCELGVNSDDEVRVAHLQSSNCKTRLHDKFEHHISIEL